MSFYTIANLFLSHLLPWSLDVVAFSNRLCGSPAAYTKKLLVVTFVGGEMATSQSVAWDFLCAWSTNFVPRLQMSWTIPSTWLLRDAQITTNGQSNENYKQEFCCCPLLLHTISFLGGNEVKIIFFRSPPHKCTQPWRRDGKDRK